MFAMCVQKQTFGSSHFLQSHNVRLQLDDVFVREAAIARPKFLHVSVPVQAHAARSINQVTNPSEAGSDQVFIELCHDRLKREDRIHNRADRPRL